MSKKKKVETLEIGAFVLTRYDKDTDKERISVRSISDNFRLTWSGGNPVLLMVSRLWEEGKKETLEFYLALCYQVCSMIPDGQMFEDWVGILQSWYDRNVTEQPDLTEDEETALRHTINLQSDMLDPEKMDKAFDDAIKELENPILAKSTQSVTDSVCC